MEQFLAARAAGRTGRAFVNTAQRNDRPVDPAQQGRRSSGWGPVPERYNMAVDVCDGQDPDGPAMLYRRGAGPVERVSWGWMQDRACRFGTFLRSRGDQLALGRVTDLDEE
jgi:hypothetical protein